MQFILRRSDLLDEQFDLIGVREALPKLQRDLEQVITGQVAPKELLKRKALSRTRADTGEDTASLPTPDETSGGSSQG